MKKVYLPRMIRVKKDYTFTKVDKIYQTYFIKSKRVRINKDGWLFGNKLKGWHPSWLHSVGNLEW